MKISDAIASIEKDHPFYKDEHVEHVLVMLREYETLYHLPPVIQFDPDKSQIEEASRLIRENPSLSALCTKQDVSLKDIEEALNAILLQCKLPPLSNTESNKIFIR